MGLCAGETKRRRPTKTIIIPKGIINPNENNVIEIPLNFDATDSLIVKPPNDINSCFSVEPYYGTFSNIPIATYPATPASGNATFDTLLSEPMNSNAYYAEHARDPNMYDTRGATSPVHQPVGTCNVSKVDFGCQSSLPQGLPCHSVGIQQPPLVATCGQQTLQEAHSPLCPICAKTTCKYFVNAGINRPCNTRMSHFSSPLLTNQTNTIRKPPYFGLCNAPNFPYSVFSNTRSEVSSRSKDHLDNEYLNKMLDEKVEKILKPVLSYLARFSRDEEDAESFVQSSSYIPKYSMTSLPSKCSRDQCNGRIADMYSSPYDDYRPKPSSYNDAPFLQRNSQRDSDYQRYRRDPKRGENSPYNYEDCLKDEGPRRQSLNLDRDPFVGPFNCPIISSCQKRSYGEQGRNEKSDRADPFNTSFLNDTIISSSSQKRPNLSYLQSGSKDVESRPYKDEDAGLSDYEYSQRRTSVSFGEKSQRDLKQSEKDGGIQGSSGTSLIRRNSFRE